MEREHTATFIGHNECHCIDAKDVRDKIIYLIESGVTDFLCGGMGHFDVMCARIVAELKKFYPHVHCYLVIPYLTFKIYDDNLYDSILYPEGFEKYHFKAAIPRRNKYLIDNSAYAICYVTHGWGGAAQTLAQANKKGLTIINLGEGKNGKSNL